MFTICLSAKKRCARLADMKTRGLENVAQQVRAQQSDIALLMVGTTYAESYWLLFPNKHMVLWRYEGPSGLLKWTPADFPVTECATYQAPFGGCSGREITPEGKLSKQETAAAGSN